MASLIEQAAQRLEQLRRSGVVTPGAVTPRPTPADSAGATLQMNAPSEAPAATAPHAVAALPPMVRRADAPAAPLPTLVESPVAPKPPHTSRQVELDLDLLAASGIVTPNAPRSHTADQYRVIKRPLIRNAMEAGPTALAHGNLIMVTSAVAGEGKSFTSVNLAMSMAAELDHTVMLVDADVARPSILKMLGLEHGPGLLDLLDGDAELSDVMLKTSIPKLTILPSGTPHPRATELLASDTMRVLLDEMSKRYADRIIIFDSPPLLLTTESRVLATQMGQVVVVVQADKTLRADVQQALSTIDSCPVKMMLLNKAQADGTGAYGYGYGYAYGYGQEKSAS